DGFDSPVAGYANSDGVIEAHTCDPRLVAIVGPCQANYLDDTVSSPFNMGSGVGANTPVATGLDRSGAFMSARARWIVTPQTGYVFYVLAGGATQYVTTNCSPSCYQASNGLQNGFGFKAVGSALNGITISNNGTATLVDLATALTTNTWI